uniref:Uncharacterized protein n=1 Tax=viral metagenome TaxID=1070528 RepID=A0A6C0CTI7_9ZZZZ
MTIKDDIASKLEFINNSYIEEKLQTELTGKYATIYITAPEKTKNAQGTIIDNPNYFRFVHDIFDYHHFISQSLPGTVRNVAVPAMNSTLYNKIYIKKSDNNIGSTNFNNINIPTSITNAYVGLDNNRIKWNLGNDELLNSEYNFSILLQSLGSATTGATIVAYGNSFGGRNIKLLDILNRLRVAYNILDGDTFDSYRIDKTNNQTKLTKPVALYLINTSTGKNTIVTDIKTLEEMVYPIIDLNNVNPTLTRLDVIRRVLYMYEMLIHIYISYYLLEKSAGTPYSVIAYDIAYSSTRILNARNLVITDVGSSVYQINADIGERINKYKVSQTNIEKEADKLKTNKMDLRVESDRLAINKSYMNKNKSVFIAYFVLFIIIVTVSVSILSTSMLSTNMKRLSMGILSAISLIAIVVMYIINRFVLKEYFQMRLTTPDLSIASIIEKATWENEKNNLIDIILDQVNDYLSNSINIVSLLATYKGYGDMNFSTNKEQAYYENINAKLDVEKDNIATTNRIMIREGKISRYRVYYFLELLVTITIASLLSVYIPSTTTFATILASILIITFTWLYIINVNNLVRTDGSKMYWGQPNLKEF